MYYIWRWLSLCLHLSQSYECYNASWSWCHYLNFNCFQPECQDAPGLYFIKTSEHGQVAVFFFNSCQSLLMHYWTLYSFLNWSLLTDFVYEASLSTVQSPAFAHILSTRVYTDDSSREVSNISHDYGGMSSRGFVIFCDIKRVELLISFWKRERN